MVDYETIPAQLPFSRSSFKGHLLYSRHLKAEWQSNNYFNGRNCSWPTNERESFVLWAANVATINPVRFFFQTPGNGKERTEGSRECCGKKGDEKKGKVRAGLGRRVAAFAENKKEWKLKELHLAGRERGRSTFVCNMAWMWQLKEIQATAPSIAPICMECQQ